MWSFSKNENVTHSIKFTTDTERSQKNMPTPKALLYRQKDKLLRLIVFKVQKSVCLKIYVAKLVIVQRLVLNINWNTSDKLLSLECYSGHKWLRHWNCTFCKDTMIIPYQDALQIETLFEQCDSGKTTTFSHPMHHFKYQWKTQNFNCAKIKEVTQHQAR